MSYMESKIQEQYDGFEEQVELLEPFINELLRACKKHNISNGDLHFVNSLFENGYMPVLTECNAK